MMFGRYELEERLAVGGMAEVFRARLRGAGGFEKRLVIKRILPGVSRDPQFVGMFRDEAHLAAQLAHPNIVSVFDFGEVDGSYYLAMEALDGLDLEDLLVEVAAKGALVPIAVATHIVMEVAQGLDYAHALTSEAGHPLGLVHRDVSAANVFVTQGGDVKILDFGIALAAGRITRTQDGASKGKLPYMSPEQVSGARLDARSDLFSLGVVLFELLTLRRPFDAPSHGELVHRILTGRRSGVDASRAIPGRLVAIVDRLLALDPSARYESGADLYGDLADFAREEGLETTRPSLAAFVTRVVAQRRPEPLQHVALQNEHAIRSPVDTHAATTRMPASGAGIPSVDGAASELVGASLQAQGTAVDLDLLERRRVPAGSVEGHDGSAERSRLREGTPAGRGRVARRVAFVAVAAAVVLTASYAWIGSPWAQEVLVEEGAADAGVAERIEPPVSVATTGATVAPQPSPSTGAVSGSASRASSLGVSGAPAASAEAVAGNSAERKRERPRRRPAGATSPGRHASPTPSVEEDSPAPTLATGLLTLNTDPWSMVTIDGESAWTSTPIRRRVLPVGRHRLRLRNPQLGIDVTKQIQIEANRETALSVDLRLEARGP